MKDWKGNKIEVGQTVIKVAFKSMFGGSASRMVLIFTDANGEQHHRKGEEFINPMDYKWEIEGKYIITEQRNTMLISFGNRPSEVTIDSLDFMLSTQPWQILCIEGISDNEEEFFKELFK